MKMNLNKIYKSLNKLLLTPDITRIINHVVMNGVHFEGQAELKEKLEELYKSSIFDFYEVRTAIKHFIDNNFSSPIYISKELNILYYEHGAELNSILVTAITIEKIHLLKNGKNIDNGNLPYSYSEFMKTLNHLNENRSYITNFVNDLLNTNVSQSGIFKELYYH